MNDSRQHPPSSDTASAITQVHSSALYQQVIALRGRCYGTLFPNIRDAGMADPHDFGAVVWATQDPHGQVNSTARLARDGENGLPSEAYAGPYLATLRNQGMQIAEFGRFVIESASQPAQLSRRYYGHLWAEAYRTGIDTVVMVARQSKVTLYGSLFGARQVCRDIGEDFGSGSPFSVYLWHISKTAPAFFTWSGLSVAPTEESAS